MLQPQMALRGICLPFRCLSSLPSRAYSTATQQQTSTQETSQTVSQSSTFSPPPVTSETAPKIRRYKPITPGIRHLRRPVNDHLWKGRPVHRLTFPKKGHGKGGRNNYGKVTVRHHGGGHKRRIRKVDFTRAAPGPQVVERIEYDPGRSAHIALLRSKETQRLSYIVAPDGMRAGEVIQSYMAGIPNDLWESMGGVIDPGVLAARTAWRGNCLPLHMVPVGSLVFNVGLQPGKGGVLCRSAGAFATVVAKGQDQLNEAERQESSTEDKKPPTQRERQQRERIAEHVTIRLRSGEVRLIHKNCCATIGIASNPGHQYAQWGKAGRSRWKNVRPTVRGMAMNAADHPHGGGRGKSKGNVHPKSPWGLPVSILFRGRNFALPTNTLLGQVWFQDSSQVED